MPGTVTNREAKGCWSVLVLSLVALVGGICVSGHAQSNTQKDVPFANLKSSLPAKLAIAASKPSKGKSATDLSNLPADAQGPISAALGKDDSGYWVHRDGEGFHGENQQHALVVEFTRQGAEVRSHLLGWLLETRGYGYGDALYPAKAVAPQAEANRVEYRRDGVTEWYENGPLGLEQGFTLIHSPGKANGQALTLELALRGHLMVAVHPSTSEADAFEAPVLGQEGKTLELKRQDGKAALRYTGLTARDAAGRELPSWMEVRGERLLLRVDDRAARYPLVVDPWIQQGELTASDGAAQDQFGNSVAISGNTVVVGSPDHSFGTTYGAGAAYVFVENGGTWSRQAELSASDGAAYDAFGLSVAISGSTIMVGAPCHTNSNGQCGQGAVYVFGESGGKWTQQAELTASDGVGGDGFGWSVAVQGTTAVVGAYGKEVMGHSAQGAAYVFAESGGTWTQQAELTASDGIYTNEFGYSVALDGNTIVIGAPYRTVGSNQAQGVTYVFAGSGASWSQQAEVTSSDGEAGDFFGWSVAVVGSTAVMGAPCHPRNGFAFCQGGSGAAYVFGESGGTWSQQAELTPSDGVAGDSFGVSVSMSGSTIVAGANQHPFGAGQQGAAYVFAENGGAWSQQAELTASDGVGGDYLGWSVSIDGSRATVGAPAHTVGSNASQGAAHVFVPSVTTVSISPTALSFGNVAINSTSAPKTVTLENTGSTALEISSITASTPFAVSSNTCGATLASGKICKVSVTFTPTQLGPLTGTLSFTDNAAGSPQAVALSGTGVTDAKLSPASATYAKQKVGTISAAKTFTLTNNQTVALTSIAISTTGDFAVSSSTCTTSLAAKGKCTISVTFTPSATGKRTGQLRVSDSASNSPQTSNLTGTGD